MSGEEQRPGVITYTQPVHITLTKTTKGYTWELSVHSATREEAQALIDEMDKQMREKYGQP